MGEAWEGSSDCVMANSVEECGGDKRCYLNECCINIGVGMKGMRLPQRNDIEED